MIGRRTACYAVVMSLFMATFSLLPATPATAHGNCYVPIGVPVRGPDNSRGEASIYFHARHWCSYVHDEMIIHFQPQKLRGNTWECYPFCFQDFQNTFNSDSVKMTRYKECTAGYFRVKVTSAIAKRNGGAEHSAYVPIYGQASNYISCG